MILRRMGNKRKLSGEIISMFPKHSVYIEPFFGAGGLFFNKPKSKYNIVNDIDADVFNLFMVVMNDKEALREAFFQMPIHTDLLIDVQFMNKDFRIFLKSIQIKKPENFFIYCDPPYLGTNDNYSNSFTKEDVVDLFDCLEATKCKFAVSEFDHEFILEEAERRGLVVNYIGERQNLKNRRSEILITNYQASHTLF